MRAALAAVCKKLSDDPHDAAATVALALFGRIVLRRDDCAAGKKHAERRAAVAKANAARARAAGTEMPADQPAESYTPR